MHANANIVFVQAQKRLFKYLVFISSVNTRSRLIITALQAQFHGEVRFAVQFF